MSPAGALQGTTNLGDFKDPRSRCHMSHPMTTAVTQQRPCASHVLLSYASYRFIATGAEMTGEKARPSLPPQVLRTPESCQKISAKAPSMITTANAPVCPPVWGTKMEKHLSLSGSQWVSVGLRSWKMDRPILDQKPPAEIHSPFDLATSSEETRELPGPRNGFGAHINRHPARSHSEGLRG
jgi:hypothetical protein